MKPFVLCLALAVLSLPAAARACLIGVLPEDPHRATGAELLTPRRYAVEAGGEVALPCAAGALPERGGIEGYSSETPAASFVLTGMAPHILGVRGFGECPLRLIVRSALGYWVLGRDPTPAPPDGYGEELYLWMPGDGLMHVWLATEEAAGCAAEIELETYDH